MAAGRCSPCSTSSTASRACASRRRLKSGRPGDPIDIRVTLLDGRPAHFFGAFHDLGVARGLIVPAEAGARLVHGESNVEPVFQPIRRLDTLAVAGFEALARFRAPDGQLVGPDTLVGLGRRHGLDAPSRR